MKRGWIAAVGLALSSLASAGNAQSWEAPTFFSPRAADDLGIYAVDTKGGDFGLAGIWRQSGNVNLGVRAGFGGRSGDRAWLVGTELSGMLLEPEPGRPLAAAWVLGAGAAFDGATWLRIPAGVSVGVRLGEGAVTVMPYAHPRASLDWVAYDAGGEEVTDTDVNLDVDLGAELELGAKWTVRAAVTLGDREAFGFGLAWRIPRGVSVR